MKPPALEGPSYTHTYRSLVGETDWQLFHTESQAPMLLASPAPCPPAVVVDVAAVVATPLAPACEFSASITPCQAAVAAAAAAAAAAATADTAAAATRCCVILSGAGDCDRLVPMAPGAACWCKLGLLHMVPRVLAAGPATAPAGAGGCCWCCYCCS